MERIIHFIKAHSVLLLILAVSIFLRVVYLQTIPNGFHVDELNAGYIGRYIWTHGKDILGNVLPLTYNKFGDYRPAGIFYVSGLSVLLLGSTEFAVRLPAALFGAFTIIGIYLLAIELFQKKKIALLSAAALAIMPWHIVLSRATSEGVIGLFFVITGFGLMLRGIRNNAVKTIVIGGAAVAASYLFYHSFRVLVPFLIVPLCFYPVRNKQMKHAVYVLAGLFGVLTFLTVFSIAGKGRLGQVAFYNNPNLSTLTQNLIASEGPNHVLEARIYHNKIVIYVQEFIQQYARYFSTDFLIIKGGLPFRYSVPQVGLIYVTFLLLFLIGMITIVLSKSKWLTVFLLYLFFISPLPAAVTYEDTPNIHRAILMILPLSLFIGYGFYRLSEYLKNHYKYRIIPIFIIISLIGLETVNFWHYNSVQATSSQSFYRDDGYTQLIHLAINERNKYKTIYLSGYDNLPLYYLFFMNDYGNIPFINAPNDVLLEQKDNVRFLPDWCPTQYLRQKNKLETGVLMADKEECEGFTGVGKIRGIVRKDLTTAFILRTVSKTR